MEVLDILWLGKPAWMWLMFMGLVLALLVFGFAVTEALGIFSFLIALLLLFAA